eukprot:1178029-Prorocentrum_minimum.AAC.2
MSTGTVCSSWCTMFAKLGRALGCKTTNTRPRSYSISSHWQHHVTSNYKLLEGHEHAYGPQQRLQTATQVVQYLIAPVTIDSDVQESQELGSVCLKWGLVPRTDTPGGG